MIERRTAGAITAKRRGVRGEINLSSKKKDESDTRDDIDPNQTNPNQVIDKYPVELLEEMQ